MKHLKFICLAFAIFLSFGADGQNVDYEGFYLCTKPKKMALLVYQNKIHGFTKNRLTSMQKLEEYDFTELNKEGKFQINATYWVDRTGAIVKKNTLLTDTKPIIENGETIALERNGWIYHKAHNFRAVFEMLKNDYSSPTDILKIGKETYHWTDENALAALENTDFYTESGMHLEKLRGGELGFAELVDRLINKQK